MRRRLAILLLVFGVLAGVGAALLTWDWPLHGNAPPRADFRFGTRVQAVRDARGVLRITPIGRPLAAGERLESVVLPYVVIHPSVTFTGQALGFGKMPAGTVWQHTYESMIALEDASGFLQMAAPVSDEMNATIAQAPAVVREIRRLGGAWPHQFVTRMYWPGVLQVARLVGKPYSAWGWPASAVLLGAGIVLARRPPRAAGRCATCGYDLRGLAGPTCPECGKPARAFETLGKPQTEGPDAASRIS